MSNIKSDLYERAMEIAAEDFPKTGIFVTRIRLISVEKVKVPEEIIVDKNGEKHVGLMGYWKCTDEDGNIFFKDPHSFKYEYMPLDSNAFKIVKEDGYMKSKWVNKILAGLNERK